MGVILFTMVTGAMPYLTEASPTDALYRLILRRCHQDYWDCWRNIRETNSKKSVEEDLDEMIVEETSFTQDIKEAVGNCMRSFLNAVLTFLKFIVNTLKFVLTLGYCNDLFVDEKVNLPRPKYSYSEEFKDLVMQMMAYNHRDRPSVEQIRQHPWIRLGDSVAQTEAEQA